MLFSPVFPQRAEHLAERSAVPSAQPGRPPLAVPCADSGNINYSTGLGNQWEWSVMAGEKFNEL